MISTTRSLARLLQTVLPNSHASNSPCLSVLMLPAGASVLARSMIALEKPYHVVIPLAQRWNMPEPNSLACCSRCAQATAWAVTSAILRAQVESDFLETGNFPPLAEINPIILYHYWIFFSTFAGSHENPPGLAKSGWKTAFQ